MMTLSAEPKSRGYHAKDYQALSQITKEGIYANLVNASAMDRVSQRFFSSMDVYPSSKSIFIREYFGTM